MDQCVLAHHGIKGMKWGVRRTPEQLGYAPRKKRKLSIKIRGQDQTPTKKETPKATSSPNKKKSVHEMSDDELRQIINRIELERRYSTLTAPQKSKGQAIVTSILAESAKKTATKYTSKAMDKAVESLLKSVTRSSSSGGGTP